MLDVSPQVGERLYARCGLSAGIPSRSTLWRVIAGADAASVDAAIGAWLAAQHATTAALRLDEREREHAGDDVATVGLVAVMVDGKTVRGAVDGEGHQVHLLAAATHEHGLVLAQAEVGAKTNEIPMFEPLLDTLDINGTVIMADSLHHPAPPRHLPTKARRALRIHGQGQPAQPLRRP